DPGGRGLQGEPHHRDPEPVARRDRLAGALDAADGEEPAPGGGPDLHLLPHRRELGRGDLRFLRADGQGRRGPDQLHRADLGHHGPDGRADAAARAQRRGPRRQRGRDLLGHPADERDAEPDGPERRGPAPRGGGRDRAAHHHDREHRGDRVAGAPGGPGLPAVGGGDPGGRGAPPGLDRLDRREVGGDRPDREGDRGDRRPDQPAGPQRGHRGGPGGRGRPRIRRGGGRGAPAGRAVGAGDPGDRVGDRDGAAGDPGRGAAHGHRAHRHRGVDRQDLAARGRGGPGDRGARGRRPGGAPDGERDGHPHPADRGRGAGERGGGQGDHPRRAEDEPAHPSDERGRGRAAAGRRADRQGGGVGGAGLAAEPGRGGADERRRQDARGGVRGAAAAGGDLPGLRSDGVSSSSASAADRLAALGAVTGPEREAAILAALEDEAPLARDLAIRLASRYVEPQVLGALVADGENAARRNGALAALERQGPYAVPYLLELLRSPDAELVMFALQVLARIGEPTSTAGIRPLLRHPDPNVAQAAIETLGRLRTADAVPALLELLDGELWLQLAAVTALGEIGDPAAVRPLLALVPGSVLAEPAVRALQRIAAPESLEPLLRLLSEIAEPGLRQAVLEAVAVVLDFHSDPTPVATGFAGELERAGTLEGLTAYLSEILRRAEAEAECARELGSPGPADEPALALDAAAQAAAAVALTARLRGLYPLVLRRVGDPDAPWAEPLWRRHGAVPREELAALLSHPEPAVRRGILLAGGFDPADLHALLVRLNDGEPAVRAAACRALGVTGDGRAA